MKKNRLSAALLYVTLLLSLACTVQAVAWVVTNYNVSSNKINVYVSVPHGIYISTDTDAAAAAAAETLTTDNMASYGFSTSVALPAAQKLAPVSTADAVTFYRANRVNAAGAAVTATDADTYRAVTDPDGYYLQTTLYVVNTYTQNCTLRLTEVTMTTGSGEQDADSELYLAVRAAVTCGGTTQIYRASGSDAVQPATGLSAVAATDPARNGGTQSQPQSVTLQAAKASLGESASTMSGMKLTVVPVVVTIWIEGQSTYADAADAGTNFRVTLTFDEGTTGS